MVDSRNLALQFANIIVIFYDKNIARLLTSEVAPLAMTIGGYITIQTSACRLLGLRMGLRVRAAVKSVFHVSERINEKGLEISEGKGNATENEYMMSLMSIVEKDEPTRRQIIVRD